MRAASNPVRLGKYSLGKIFFTICKYVLLIFAAFCALVPLVSCVITAFKTKAEYNNTNVMTLPEAGCISTTLLPHGNKQTWAKHS